MKKTLFIAGLSLATILTMTGCNNTSNEEAIIDNLSHQLDKTTNTVSSVTLEPTDNLNVEGVSKILSNSSSNSFAKLSNIYQNAKNTSSDIEKNKTEILSKAKMLKKEIAGGVNLGNKNASAISELTSSMQKYTTNLGKTKSDYKNTIKSIAKQMNTIDENELDAKATRLNCCLEARNCYLKNILLTLNNIENILTNLDNQEDYNLNYDNANQSLDMNNVITSEQTSESANLQQENAMINNYPYYNQYENFNNYRNNTFNPNRNTDTYGPGITNIDTYRNYGYNNYNNGYYNGYNNFQGNRHFGGSNGVNNITIKENDLEKKTNNVTETSDENLYSNNSNEENNVVVETDKDKVEAKETSSQNNQRMPVDNNSNIKKYPNEKGFKKEISDTRGKEDTKKVLPAKTKENNINNTEEFNDNKQEDLKIKSVMMNDDSSDQEIKNNESLGVEDKDLAKGHTQSLSFLNDINKKIERLIKN